MTTRYGYLGPEGTFTQMAQEAIGQLRAAPREILQESVRTLQAKGVAGPDIVSLLERRTRIGEVLSGSAARWSAGRGFPGRRGGARSPGP